MYRTGWHQGCTVLGGIKGVSYWMASRVYRTGWHQGCTVLGGIKGVPYWMASRVYRTGWHQGCTVLGGIKGVRNIIDDIIVFGVDQQDVDRALSECPRKLHESGLTVNLPKCEFNK